MNQSCRCGRVSWPCLNLLLLSTLAIQGHLHVNRPLDWWGTPGRWGNLCRHGQNIKRVYMQSYNPGVLGWGFLRLLLRLQWRSLSWVVLSSYLKKDERFILEHICIYSWKRHALCYAMLGYARNRCLLNTLYGIVWETKYGRFTTLNIPKCEHFPLLMCPLRFLVISAMRRLGYVQSSKTYMFLPWTRPQLGGLHHLETFTWQIVTPADRVILPGRPGNPPWRVTPPIV